jgi:hypothetical protein
MTTEKNTTVSFWRWFFGGNQGARAGARKLLDRWLLLHLVVGTALSILVPVSLKVASNSFLLPLAGIFIGLSFAWGGNAQALLQTSEIEEMSERHPEGFSQYVFTFQLAILVILLTLTLWGLAGLHVFDDLWPTQQRGAPYRIVGAVLYGLASLTLRECWHVVLGAQLLLLARRTIRRDRQPPASSSK